MELNDYLSSLNDRLNKQLGDINSRLGNDLDRLYSSAGTSDSARPGQEASPKKSLPALIHEERLEDASKSKLGTFEKIYNEIFTELTKAPIQSFGFGDLDFSPLVNPLMALLEIELNHTLYQEIRRLNGIDISRYFSRNAPTKKICIDEETVNLGSRKQMLGCLRILIAHFSNELSSCIPDITTFIALLKEVTGIRNGASHGSFIGKERFQTFYLSFAKLYNENICQLMDLKERLIGLSSGYGDIFSYGSGAFSFDSGSQEDEYIRDLYEEVSSSRMAVRRGVMMTDCERLAMKYSGDIKAADEIREFFLTIVIPAYDKVGVSYTLFDVSEKFKEYIKESEGWRGYHKALYAFCRESCIDTEGVPGLFIIGGDDVIPMPKVENPSYHEGFGILEKTIDADMLYAYEEEYVRIIGENRLEANLLIANIDSPSFNVGRLPLENGMLVSSFSDDILDYLKRAVTAHGEGGIRIDSPLFTTCHRARKCGKQLIAGLPVMKLADKENAFEDNMAVSPLLMLKEEKERAADSRIIRTMTSEEAAIDKAFDEYAQALTSSDMLIFFLHGGYNPAYPVYSGDAILKSDSDEGERLSPAVFAPGFLESRNVNIKSIAAVSCYGARFIDYARRDSALLTAMYNDTLLFYGSSRTAFGPFDDSLEYFGGKIHWSLIQMREYLKRLFAGIPAGEALTLAKQRYIRTTQNQDECSKTTILEFNLFGDPLLNLHKMIDLDDSSHEEALPEYIIDKRSERSYETVYLKEAKEENASLLQRIRGMVDMNLEGVHREISEQLYRQYSLKPRELYNIRSYSDGYGNRGYSYSYKHQSETFDSYTFVETDTRGIVKSMIETI